MATGIGRNRRAIGTFPSRNAVEQALHELRDSGFPMERVSVVAQDSARNETIAGADVRAHADNKADEGAKVGALSGGALGGLTGLLVGIGALAIPGVGPIMLAGAAATALATTAAGGAIGAAAGGLLGGLIGLGIPEERARVYNDRVSAGEYLVMVDGTDTEIAHAQAILNHRGIEEWGVYDVPTAEAATPVVAEPVLQQPVLQSDTEAVKLYEERLVVDKSRKKTGEVAIGKHTEVETVRASVPVERERVVIEHVPQSGETVATPGADAFHNSEAVRMEIYEETPAIQKESFVSEEISIRKEVYRETVDAEETLRREELDIDTQGHPAVDNRSNPPGTAHR